MSTSLSLTILVMFILTGVNLHFSIYLENPDVFAGIGLGTSSLNIVFSFVSGINQGFTGFAGINFLLNHFKVVHMEIKIINN